MTYGCAAHAILVLYPDGAAVSHQAELVRGKFASGMEGPLIRSFGPPSPQGEKGHVRPACFHALPLVDLHVLEIAGLVVDADLGLRDPGGELAPLPAWGHEPGG